ncbi:putrescine transporter ATP-binding subunit [compost metagenome]
MLRGVVEDLGYFGDLSVYRVRLPGGRKLEVSAQNRVRRSSKSLEWDDQVFLSWDVRSAILLQD